MKSEDTVLSADAWAGLGLSISLYPTNVVWEGEVMLALSSFCLTKCLIQSSSLDRFS